MTAAMDLYAVYVGEQLGLYRTLHEQGPASSEELAARTGMHERYAREWLEHQAITGMLTFDGAGEPAEKRDHALPSSYESVLINPESCLFVAPLGRMLTAKVSQAPSLLSAYRTGSGVGWSTFGDDMRSAQSDFNSPLLGRYDLVCAFECIHDLSDPVGVPTSMRMLAKPDGRVIVIDGRCAEDFGAVGDLLERYFYGFSIMVCLPNGMSHQPSAGNGTVMRPSTLGAYAREAGFALAEVLPLKNDFFRF